MSVPMKKPRTNKEEMEIVVREDLNLAEIKKFIVPKEKAEGVLIFLREFRVKDEETVSADEVFKDLYDKYGKTGVALRGARLKEDFTQVELAKKLKITQADLSKMENGKRTISKKMAKKLSQILNIDYRVFL